MRIYGIEMHAGREAATLSASVLPDGEARPRRLWFRFAGYKGAISGSADPFVTAMLPFCMAEGEELRVDGSISPTLRSNLGHAQLVLSGWYDFLHPVPVEATSDAETASGSGSVGVACCFSGGVDSWYSLLSHAHRVTHLFLVRGFDGGIGNRALWSSMLATAEAVARWTERPLITCETNLRLVADKDRAESGAPHEGDFWGKCLHGAALAAAAQALGGDFGELVIPSTFHSGDLKPWGSSPELDRYWSNGAVRIVHDSCEVDWVEKVGRVAGSQLALDTLRVCYHDCEQTNCGRCEKCLRTMMALRLHGALDRASTFPGEEVLARACRIEPPKDPSDYEMLLHAARRTGDADVARLCEVILGRRFSAERSLALLVRRLRRGGATPATANRQDDAAPRDVSLQHKSPIGLAS
ncbi:MAG: hypothetical protein WD270_09115 [Acetobacterales bacterium]